MEPVNFLVNFVIAPSLICILSSNLVNCQQEELLCPPAEEITPCNCVVMQQRSYCFGQGITQAHVDRLISAVRRANKKSDEEWLYIPRFEILDTNLNTLNLSSLHKIEAGEVRITNNKQLTTIIGPWSTTTASATMQLKNSSEWITRIGRLVLDSNNLTDQGLGTFLKFVEPPFLTSLSMTGNQLTGGQYISDEGYTEFIPGLSTHRKLQSLALGGNEITYIGGGQFQRHQRIYTLSLVNNPITSIGENAFLFQEQDPDMSAVLLQIGLGLLPLPYHGIHPSSGLDSISRPIRYMLTQDYFLETFPEDAFSFIFDHPDTKLIVHNCYIICDPRVKWMKASREILESKVEGAWCANDEGKTVFTSELVD